jgi:hypothetical protein
MFFIRGRRLWSNHPFIRFTKAGWIGRKVDVFVHHTADSGPKFGAHATEAEERAYLRRIEDFHMRSRGYAGIGYSYIVMPSGRVYEGRGFNAKGAHTLDPKDADGDGKLIENTEVGICFAGNFDRQHPTPQALKAYRRLRRRLRLKGVRLDQTFGHRHAFSTSCPGDNLVRALGL